MFREQGRNCRVNICFALDYQTNRSDQSRNGRTFDHISSSSRIQEPPGVPWVEVTAQTENAHGWVTASDIGGGADAVATRHRHIHDDNVRRQGSSLVDRIRPATRLTDDLEVRLRIDENLKALAQQYVVVCEDDPDATLRRSCLSH